MIRTLCALMEDDSFSCSGRSTPPTTAGERGANQPWRSEQRTIHRQWREQTYTADSWWRDAAGTKSELLHDSSDELNAHHIFAETFRSELRVNSRWQSYERTNTGRMLVVYEDPAHRRASEELRTLHCRTHTASLYSLTIRFRNKIYCNINRNNWQWY